MTGDKQLMSDRVTATLENWIWTKTSEILKFSSENKIFGLVGKNNYALNCIMIIVRKTVYDCKINIYRSNNLKL